MRFACGSASAEALGVRPSQETLRCGVCALRVGPPLPRRPALAPCQSAASQEPPGAARDRQGQYFACLYVAHATQVLHVMLRSHSAPPEHNAMCEPGAGRSAGRSSEEPPGAARDRQEPPGAARSSQERSQEPARRRQEPPGAARSSQDLQIIGFVQLSYVLQPSRGWGDYPG